VSSTDDARRQLEAEEFQQALQDGKVTYQSMPPEQEAALLASLDAAAARTAADVDDMLVVTSLRLPVGIHRKVKAYAEAKGLKPTAVMRSWIEAQLAAVEDDHAISLAEALTALRTLRRPA
jgi:predicted DNA-binding protein